MWNKVEVYTCANICKLKVKVLLHIHVTNTVLWSRILAIPPDEIGKLEPVPNIILFILNVHCTCIYQHAMNSDTIWLTKVKGIVFQQLYKHIKWLLDYLLAYVHVHVYMHFLCRLRSIAAHRDHFFSLLRQKYPPILTSGEMLSHPGGWDKPIPEVIHLWRHKTSTPNNVEKSRLVCV